MNSSIDLGAQVDESFKGNEKRDDVDSRKPVLHTVAGVATSAEMVPGRGSAPIIVSASACVGTVRRR
eukprot:CAMPEP_0182833412 /NCGR_PEP_ID=MMETSP0006_2-20121128/20282_1 /TAXON_ID=97485 /ORGANISM="Prymnesium parvum, Strain Texoma1" /LENGTH=66 /DNA_ID=CAMNT_0024961419 /DNA_START=223 /DNA_END=423 /DNA_ORIENTATION=-